ncbi:hypothetical protein BOX15_Mlig023293g2, partial [Macrostomum lignano]
DLPHRFEPVLSACHHLPVARFAQLCSTACRICLPSAANAGGSAPQLPADPAEKEATAVLAGAMAESLSRGLPMSALLAALEERGLSGEHLAAFASVAAEFADAGASRQSPGQLPHVVGVDWRLDYLLGRNSNCSSSSRILSTTWTFSPTVRPSLAFAAAGTSCRTCWLSCAKPWQRWNLWPPLLTAHEFFCWLKLVNLDTD